MNDLTFGATLLACFAVTVVTVWMEATSPTERTHVAPAVAHGSGTPQRVAKKHDKDCTATVAAAPVAVD